MLTMNAETNGETAVEAFGRRDFMEVNRAGSFTREPALISVESFFFLIC